MFFPGRRRLNFLSPRKKDDAKNLFIAALANIILCFVNWQKIGTTSQNPELSAISGELLMTFEIEWHPPLYEQIM